MTNWQTEFINWIYRHETLTSSLIALFAALITVLVLVRQIRQSDRHHRIEHQKKLESARAVLPLALSRVVFYAEHARDYLLTGKTKLTNAKPHDDVAPQIPDDVIFVLREVIEYADDDKVGHALRDLISEIQVHHARMLGIPTQTKTKEPTDRTRIWMPRNHDKGIREAVHLYLHAEAFFDYARFETNILPDKPTDVEVKKQMDFLGITIP